MFTDKYGIVKDRSYIFTHRSDMLTGRSYIFTHRSDMFTDRSYIFTHWSDMLTDRTDIFTDMLMFTDKYDNFKDMSYIFTGLICSHTGLICSQTGLFLFTDRSDILYSVICYFSLMLKDKSRYDLHLVMMFLFSLYPQMELYFMLKMIELQLKHSSKICKGKIQI